MSTPLHLRHASGARDKRQTPTGREEGFIRVLIETENEFLRLIWQEIDPTRFLTPPMQPRTLRNVAERFLDGSHSFDALVSTEPQTGWLSPAAFESFRLLQPFQWGKFGELILRFATAAESAQSPEGTFYVHDGVHRSLVLAIGLLDGSVQFVPVKASVAEK